MDGDALFPAKAGVRPQRWNWTPAFAGEREDYSVRREFVERSALRQGEAIARRLLARWDDRADREIVGIGLKLQRPLMARHHREGDAVLPGIGLRRLQ
jgi:hypothetical protein